MILWVNEYKNKITASGWGCKSIEDGIALFKSLYPDDMRPQLKAVIEIPLFNGDKKRISVKRHPFYKQ